jgi:uncharacterized membrane protein (GlpM family)
MAGETEQSDDRIRFRPREILGMGRRQALIRFAAGAGASLVAALVSELAGARTSGPLLALPAILLASFTLVEDDKGAEAARDDARGAVLGAVGMAAFAVVAALLLGRMPTWAALAAAAAAWAAVSLVLYGAQRLVRRARSG